MMRLEQVEISGFKSFCDRQEVSFQGGVTGIVGPNGCGKSNISDAISWVLGEQSAKSLRGAGMQDVIFNGSSARQPVGVAEVNLRVSGLNGNSPDGAPEAMVTRRLYRDGESEYLMNGRTCRLKDVHELFMDTGLGSKAYSIIEQGKIGMILSTKPTDRRALIEEAAGITKYKARRRQTSLKLDAAQQNLLRVNDIVHEVEKQLESLKRQASKARRYRTLKEEMQAVERVVFGLRFIELDARARDLQQRIGGETERERAVSVALESEEAQLEVRRTAFYEDEGRLEETRNRHAELTLAVDRHQSHAGYCKEQIAESEKRAEQASTEASDLQARVVPLAEKLDQRRADAERLKEEAQSAQDESEAADRAVREGAERLVGVESEQETVREKQLATISHIAALQNAREAVAGSSERAAADLLKLAAERAELDRESQRVLALFQDAQQRGQHAQEQLESLRSDHGAAAQRGANARETGETAKREADRLQSERDGLSGRLSSLEEIVATHAAFDEGVRGLLERKDELHAVGVVADLIEANPEYERAVEAFFGDRLQALIVPTADDARRGIELLQQTGSGRATFLPLSTASAQEKDCECFRRVQRGEPAVKGLLSDIYRAEGPHATKIRSSLPNALVVGTLDEALELRARHKGVPVVTLAGDAFRGGMVEGGPVNSGVLAPRRQIREITERLEGIGATLGVARERVREQTAVAEAADSEAKQLVSRIHDAEKELVAVEHERATSEEEAQRLERKAAVVRTEQSQAEEEKAEAGRRSIEIESALATASEERERTNAQLVTLAEALAAARAASEAAQTRSAEARSQLAALRERSVAAASESERLAHERAELDARIAANRQRAEESQKRQDELRAEMTESERLLAESLGERDRAGSEVTLIEARVRELREELDAREAALKERRRERDTLREAVAELEVAMARSGSDLDHLARESYQSVEATAAECAAALGEGDKTQSLEQLEEQRAEYRSKLEKMGAVNVLAVEQQIELDERFEFLTVQRQDLLDSIGELESAVRKIDATSKERFREAFQVINQHFGEVFRQLFGGGTAGLSLLDETNVLDSGIDIMAQPPGKRLQSVMLLSGGEKAMTAIALLFAIFQYKPSPFCILDEVDAPLDDANIGRFVGMLEGLKSQTQFVLITHSRKTMAIADQLYGVTMEEPGVSKLVSVKFT
jgi:chromosome segregation protein